MIRKEDIFQYGVSFLVSAAVVGGVYVTESAVSGAGAAAVNVALAAGTLFILGMVLLLGPLSRMFQVFDWAFKFRKELGIMGFFTAATHVYLTMFPLARNGPWGLFRSRPWSAYPGLEALIILFILFMLSNTFSTRLLGAKLWWQIQYWGVRLTFVLVAFHMVVLKYQTIASWLMPGYAHTQTPGIHYPPLVIWETQFVLLVLVVRLSELFGVKVARILTLVLTALIAVMMVWSMALR